MFSGGLGVRSTYGSAAATFKNFFAPQARSRCPYSVVLTPTLCQVAYRRQLAYLRLRHMRPR
eukprot:scaffold239643_cov33-Tisochrysis_lutea.AAC.2